MSLQKILSGSTKILSAYTVFSMSITTERTGVLSRPDERGMRAIQQLVYAECGKQYLLVKSPPTLGKSRALMFIALDELYGQDLRQALIVVLERAIGTSFAD